MVWVPPQPDLVRKAVIRELLAWPEGEDFNIFSTPDIRRTQRWYHRFTLPLVRALLMHVMKPNCDTWASVLLFRTRVRYWEYIGPFPDADLELALRACHESGIRERAARLHGRDARVAALLGQKPPKPTLNA